MSLEPLPDDLSYTVAQQNRSINMKNSTIIPLTIVMLAATANLAHAGLFDELFETTTTKNPATYGRIVWQQNSSQHAIHRTAFLQSAPALVPPPAASAGVAPAAPISPVPEVAGNATSPGKPIALYYRVEYEDLDNIHPCAVKMIVQVKDPCPPPRDPCSCCKPAPRYVFVEICVPPCGRPKIEIGHHGNEIEYDYGKYEVEITSKKGVVYVNYDD